MTTQTRSFNSPIRPSTCRTRGCSSARVFTTVLASTLLLSTAPSLAGTANASAPLASGSAATAAFGHLLPPGASLQPGQRLTARDGAYVLLN